MDFLRILQDEGERRPNKPSKAVIYFFMAVIMGGMIFFVYNWWRCRNSRQQHLERENELDEYDFDEVDNQNTSVGTGGEKPSRYRQAGIYKDEI